MNPIEYKITLDCRRAESQVIITAKQGEASGRKITFSLNEGRLPYKVPSGVTAVLRAKKPSGAVLYNTCTVTADGNVEYIITTQTVAEVGKLPCELQLSQDGKVIFSPNFTLLVYKNLSVDSEVESSDEFTALQDAINRAENLAGGALRVNVTYSNGAYSADKTFAEIKAAYEAGQQPYVVVTGGTLDSVYTLAYFSVPDGAGKDFVDFERYLIGEDTLETETLRIYSYTLASGSNIVCRTEEFNVPSAVRYDITQTLSDAEKAKARANIGAGTSNFDGRYSSLAEKPTIPTKTSELINDSGFGTYSKPSGGIPESDLTFDVRTKLNAREKNIITIETENVDPLNPYKSSKTLTSIKNDFTHNIEQFVFYDNISYKLEKIITDNGVEKAVFYSTARLVNDVLTYYTCEIYEGNFGYSTAGFHTYTVNNVSAVESVNGQTGVVVLDASDVGAQRPLIAGNGITIIESEDGDIIQSDAVGGDGVVSFVNEAGGAPIAQFTLNQTQDCEINVNDLIQTPLLNNYRTAAAQDVIDNGKQDVIADLATIRNGAAKGATALQSVPATYRTAAAQDVIDAGKQDKLIAGEGITIAADGKTISSSGKVSSVNGKTGTVTLNAEDIIYAKESQKLDATIAGLKAADIQTASDISELQTADASLDSRITAIETGDTPVTLYIYWESVMGSGRVSLTKNGTAMSVTDFISKMQSGAKIIIGENNDTDSESSGFSNYRYKITDSTTASLAFDVANSFNGSNRTIIISGSSSTNGLMTGYQDIDHDDLSDYSPLPEGSTPASKAWVEDYVDTKLAGGIIIPSSTVGSTKRFKLTVDDSGAISATEVTT